MFQVWHVKILEMERAEQVCVVNAAVIALQSDRLKEPRFRETPQLLFLYSLRKHDKSELQLHSYGTPLMRVPTYRARSVSLELARLPIDLAIGYE